MEGGRREGRGTKWEEGGKGGERGEGRSKISNKKHMLKEGREGGRDRGKGRNEVRERWRKEEEERGYGRRTEEEMVK